MAKEHELSQYLSIGHKNPSDLGRKDKIIIWVMSRDGRFEANSYDSFYDFVAPEHQPWRKTPSHGDFTWKLARPWLAQGRVEIKGDTGENIASYSIDPHVARTRPHVMPHIKKRITKWLDRHFSTPTIHQFAYSETIVKTALFGRGKRPVYTDYGHNLNPTVLWGINDKFKFIHKEVPHGRSDDEWMKDLTHEDIEKETGSKFIMWGRVELDPQKGKTATLAVHPDLLDNPFLLDKLEHKVTKWLDNEFGTPKIVKFFAGEKLVKTAQFDEPTFDRRRYLSVGHEPGERLEKGQKVSVWMMDEDGQFHDYIYDDTYKNYYPTHTELGNGVIKGVKFPIRTTHTPAYGRVEINPKGQNVASVILSYDLNPARRRYVEKKVGNYLSRKYDNPTIYDYSASPAFGQESQKNKKYSSKSWYKKMKNSGNIAVDKTAADYNYYMEKKAFPVVEKDGPSGYGSIGHYHGTFPQNKKEILWIIYRDGSIEQVLADNRNQTVHNEMWKDRVDDVLASGRLIEDVSTGERMTSVRLHDIYFGEGSRVNTKRERFLRKQVSKILDDTFHNPKIYIYN